MEHLLDPISILKKKEEYALEELKKDEPMVLLTSPHAMYCASISTSKAHQKITPLADYPGARIILCGRGNQSDLIVFKNEIRRAITVYEQMVHGKDLSGRLVAFTAAEILRKHYLEGQKAFSIQVAFVDILDPEDPICAISFTGEQFVGNNFLFNESGIMPITERPETLEEMKTYAKTIFGERKEGTIFWNFELTITPEPPTPKPETQSEENK
ncbi:MAG: hypothetical protein Q7K44_02110 [Candidatus Liptonbacteria bacterium]|nr:hypothetical protein [Candidatus Liptonbacteria bacterium]